MTARALYLLEPDATEPAWAPFAGVRPVAELRAGLWRIRERWEAALRQDATAILGAHVAGFSELDEPPSRVPAGVTGPAVVAASWFAPSGAAISFDPELRRLVHEGSTVAWIVPPGGSWSGPGEAGPAAEVEGIRLRGTFDLVTALERLLAHDCADFRTAPRQPVPEGSLVLGDAADVICLNAMVEPGVVFDVRHGAVVLDEGVEVRHGTRLEGPLYAGPGTRILGGYIRQSVFGPECRIRGEISTAVFLGYGNKAHDGFVGHSVVGHWVNLGAGTTTSNLKNTYGEVRLEVGGHRLPTGRLNLGTLFGDHAKTAIGTMLPTGSVISAGAHVFGASMPPKYVPPFAWGGAGERMSEEGFLTVAQRVFGRRKVEWTEARRDSLRQTYHRAVRA
jgi:UDP-N-acetylglucosamine diphosphorylase / glucose-1-phosphate thymidylyltransferase / UDP-N-acetylgalactosamine diphosphorylase / glucosamine-1-phosphate N-acetyltransferase / galactosamine-1-phosphate N-acetyltransferase